MATQINLSEIRIDGTTVHAAVECGGKRGRVTIWRDGSYSVDPAWVLQALGGKSDARLAVKQAYQAVMGR